jgi:protein O-GlcNAc transferase
MVDGLMMAAIPRRIREAQVQFDTQFMFHHYDIDFCRTAIDHGLRVGTWPIWLVHRAGSGEKGAEWEASRDRYVAKYGS